MTQRRTGCDTKTREKEKESDRDWREMHTDNSEGTGVVRASRGGKVRLRKDQ